MGAQRRQLKYLSKNSLSSSITSANSIHRRPLRPRASSESPPSPMYFVTCAMLRFPFLSAPTRPPASRNLSLDFVVLGSAWRESRVRSHAPLGYLGLVHQSLQNLLEPSQPRHRHRMQGVKLDAQLVNMQRQVGSGLLLRQGPRLQPAQAHSAFCRERLRGRARFLDTAHALCVLSCRCACSLDKK